MQPMPSTPDHAASHSLWRELRDAIRGTEADYTKIPLRRAVLLLAVPMVLELVLESTFAVVDIYFVATLGPSAVATVGLTESYLFLLYSVGLAWSAFALGRVLWHEPRSRVLAFVIGGMKEMGEPARKSLIVDLSVSGAQVICATAPEVGRIVTLALLSDAGAVVAGRR